MVMFGWRRQGRKQQERKEQEREQQTSDPVLDLIRNELVPLLPPPGDPGRANALMNLGANLLMAGYERTRSPAILDEAIGYCQQGVAATPVGDRRRASHLEHLASLLGRRYEATRNTADLDEAIETCRAALEAARTSPGFNVADCQAALGDLLGWRYAASGDPADLEHVIAAYRRAVQLTDAKLPSRPAMVRRLDAALAVQRGRPVDPAARAGDAAGARFTETGSIADLDRAVAAYRRVLDATSPGDPQRATRLQTLARTLAIRASVNGSTQDLDEAVKHFRKAVGIASARRRAELRGDLGRVLTDRYVRSDRRADLDEAVTLLTGAADARTPERTTHLIDLARTLRMRFLAAGDRADLNRSVATGRRAVALDPDDPMAQAALGNALMLRFGYVGAIADLDAAIDALRVAVDTGPPDHPSRGSFFSDLGTALQLRYQRTSDPADLDASIAAFRTGIDVWHPGQPARNEALAFYGNSLRLRCELTGNLADVDQGIEACRTALAIPDDDPNRHVIGMLLGLLLKARYARTGKLSDLDEAVAASRVDLGGGPDLGPRLTALGNLLGSRYVRTRDDADLTEAMVHFLRATTLASAAPTWRIQAARTAATIVAPSAPGQAARLLEIAVRLLPELAAARFTRDDHYHALGAFSGLASDAAALTLDDPERDPATRARDALRLLEEGRAVLLSQALNTRDDLTDLRVAQPALAARFEKLRDRLDEPVVSPELLTLLGGTRQADDRHDLADEFAAVLTQIRTKDGFARFGLPPAIEDLLDRGPVAVCNVTSYRSDALLVGSAGVTCVPLTRMTRDDVTDRVAVFHASLAEARAGRTIADRQQAQRRLTSTLEWLWDSVAEPILLALGHHRSLDDGWPRLWWAPGGLLGLLPLHAAGYHHDGSGRTVLDRVVSSYTPTLRALRRPLRAGPQRALVVADPDLPHAEAEVSTLREHLPDVVTVPAVRKDVLAKLASYRIAHFACHGHSDPVDPSRSHLRLDVPLSVADLHAVRLDDADLAYLSACRTAAIDVADLADESIHLTSAFQLAGFTQVIGTLWEIQDEIAAKVSADFYRAVGQVGAARALHVTVRGLRDQFPHTPSLWAAHLHTGAGR
ncbi:CHAT domain-containing protein [Micromonospora sp. M71_S20]|uniref:CHAT domain-containing protein n=1 Tax=Micromonospora sp. M71_S20 TaxID=592872 RepID=UPI000EAFD90F|nr:CHAT domain-containing protein [Micromonospora sp. M71_S20]